MSIPFMLNIRFMLTAVTFINIQQKLNSFDYSYKLAVYCNIKFKINISSVLSCLTKDHLLVKLTGIG
jgi:hypothetical protein